MSAWPLRVVIVGATGLLGSHLVRALWQLGVPLLCVHSGRHPTQGQASAWPGANWLAADLRDALPPTFWLSHLRAGDVVVNAAGVLREGSPGELDAVQRAAPVALFDACAARGVRCVIQVSALGAHPDARIPFLATKGMSDQHLLSTGMRAFVVRPSLVWAREGPSAGLFAALAALPVVLLPARGGELLQPGHIDDLTAGLLALVLSPERLDGPVIDMVGDRPLTLAGYLGKLRGALGLRRTQIVLPMPAAAFVRMSALAAALGSRLVDGASARMLLAGNAAPSDGFAALLGRAPRAAGSFVAPAERAAMLREARLFWLLPLLRMAVALVWLWTAAVSAGLYPVPQSLALLEAAGTAPGFARMLLPGAVAFDLLLGLATLAAPARWRVRVVWPLQLALMAFYTAVLSWQLPQFWLHPFGPLSKNLPMGAAIGVLWAADAAALHRPGRLR